MLPMSMASQEAKQLQQAAKREVNLGGVSSTLTGRPNTLAANNNNNNNSVLTQELCFLPLTQISSAGKACNITLSNMQPTLTLSGNQNQNQNHNQIQNQSLNLKGKLTSLNIVPKNLKTLGSSATSPGSSPLFQLVPAPGGTTASQPLVAILTPSGKTAVIGAGAAQASGNVGQPMVIRQAAGVQLNKVPLTLHSNGLATASSAGVATVAASGGGVLPTLQKASIATGSPVQVGNPASGQISLLANPIKPRGPLILSKVAVDKLRLKFNQAKANPAAVIISKAGNVKKVIPVSQAAGSEDKARTAPGNSIIGCKPAIPLKTVSIVTDNSTKSVLKLSKPVMKPVTLAPEATAAPAPAAISLTSITPVVPVAPQPVVPLPAPKLPPESAVNGYEPEAIAPPKVQKPEVKKPQELKELPKAERQMASSSNKLQRSKSLVGRSPPSPASGERRHSVAIMAEEEDVIMQPSTPIETITIDDDDSEQEEEQQEPSPSPPPPPQQKQAMVMPILPAGITISTTRKSSNPPARGAGSSRKSSYSSNSDVEEVVVPPKKFKGEFSLLPGISIIKAESLPVSHEDFERSLRCDEQVPNSPSSGSVASGSSDAVSPPKPPAETPKAQKPPHRNGQHRMHIPIPSPAHLQVAPSPRANALKRSMYQNLAMLQWRGQQQPASLQNSSMRFELNRFNLLQLSERCDQRQGPASYFERSLYDRPDQRPASSAHPLLYLCQRCNCHGPAADFLAPRFCSWLCVRRAHKRRTQKEVVAPSPATSDQKGRRKTTDAPKEQRSKERPRKMFRWSEYLKAKGRDVAAPIHLFPNPFPISPNCFERGMKLEAIDPENCSLFCVCTITEVRGYRLKLSFDGYSAMYDFWVNADSQDIFPPGWCEETKRVLQAPKGYCSERFSWSRYLVKAGQKAAPRMLFTHLNTGPQTGMRNRFLVGMHLEAEDLNDTGKICVATVADTLDERIRVHFDGWDDCYDFWVHINSPYIHPCGWHEGRQTLIVPPDYQKTVFCWPDYIADVGGTAAPKGLFSPRQPMEYQARMKLEVVDQRNPCLIRPATVVTRKGYRVQLHLDCWPTEYYFWLEDDSPDLHPIGWCEATSHELEPPPGYIQDKPVMPCDVEGCRGFGNAKRFNLNVHALRDCCPYAIENWRQWRSKTVKPPRVAPDSIWLGPQRKFKRVSTEAPEHKAPRTIEAIEPKTAPKVAANQEPKPKRTRRKTKQLVPKDEPKPAQKKGPQPEPDARSLALAKVIVDDYGPQYVRNYNLWQANSSFDMDQIASDPLGWSAWDVCDYVERAMDSPEIAHCLFEQEVDGRALLMLGRAELEKYLKLKMGPAVKLHTLIVNLRITAVVKFGAKTTGLGLKPTEEKKLKTKTRTKKEKEKQKPKKSPPSAKNKVNGFKPEDHEEMVVSENGDEEDGVLVSDDFFGSFQADPEDADED
ncbi:hypothetical protein KR018_005387, partial [Drosophila ironensis]